MVQLPKAARGLDDCQRLESSEFAATSCNICIHTGIHSLVKKLLPLFACVDLRLGAAISIRDPGSSNLMITSRFQSNYRRGCLETHAARAFKLRIDKAHITLLHTNFSQPRQPRNHRGFFSIHSPIVIMSRMRATAERHLDLQFEEDHQDPCQI